MGLCKKISSKTGTSEDPSEPMGLSRQELDALGLETGDLVLFDRRCSSMSPSGCVLCVCAKLVSGSRWDHIGIVVQDPLGQLRLLEAGFSGVVAYPLEQRLERSASNNICIRKLHWPRDPDLNRIVEQLYRELEHAPYESSIWTLTKAAYRPYSKARRIKVQGLLQRCLHDISVLEKELEDKAYLTQIQRNALQLELEALRSTAFHLQSKKDLMQKDWTENEGDLSALFCSELVAEAYQRFGLLPQVPTSEDYLPSHFAAADEFPPTLLKGAFLGPEIYVKAAKDLLKRSDVITVSDLIDHASRTRDENLRCALGRSRYRGHEPESAQTVRFRAGEYISFAEGLAVIDVGTIDVVSSSDERVLGTLKIGDWIDFSSESKQSLRYLSRQTTELNLLKVVKPSALSNPTTHELRRAIEKHHPSLYTSEFSSIDAFLMEVDKNDLVIVEGESGDNFYVIESGEFEVSVNREEQSQVVATLSKGSCFGEVSLLFESPRGASVVAKTPGRLLVIDKVDFFKMFNQGSKHLRKVFETLCDNRDSEGISRMSREALLQTLQLNILSSNARDMLSQLIRMSFLKFEDFIALDLMLSREQNSFDLVFRALDANGDGLVSLSDIKKVSEMWKLDFAEKDISILFGEKQSAMLNYSSLLQKLQDNPHILKKLSIMYDAARDLSEAWNSDTFSLDQKRMSTETSVEAIVNPFSVVVPWEFRSDLVLSVTAAAAARIVVAPLERIKILIQVSDQASYSVRKLFLQIYQESGVRGLFRSNGMNLSRVGLVFCAQGAVFQYLISQTAKSSAEFVDSYVLLVFGGVSAVIANALVHPLDVLRVRMAAQRYPSEWTGPIKVCREAALKSGSKGVLLFGLTPTLLYMFTYVGFESGLFETFRKWSNFHSTTGLLISGAAAMALSQTIGYPLDMIRRRMQTAPQKTTVWRTCKHIHQKHGFRGFYRGASVNWIKALPVMCTSFLVYQGLLRGLSP